jgi:hypothetical protein
LPEEIDNYLVIGEKHVQGLTDGEGIEMMNEGKV